MYLSDFCSFFSWEAFPSVGGNAANKYCRRLWIFRFIPALYWKGWTVKRTVKSSCASSSCPTPAVSTAQSTWTDRQHGKALTPRETESSKIWVSNIIVGKTMPTLTSVAEFSITYWRSKRNSGVRYLLYHKINSFEILSRQEYSF